VALADRATRDLHTIRAMLDRSGRFSAVPGRESMGMGVIALAAAAIAAMQPLGQAWLATWLTAAAVASVLGTVGLVRKSARDGVPLLAGPGRRFLLGLCPPLLAGGILTAVLFNAGLVAALPGAWLLIYGAAVMSGGTNSVPVVPTTGLTFMLLGAASFLAPPALGDAFMAAGFGGLHVVFGYVVVRRHGG
jgi:hypothetical protein